VELPVRPRWNSRQRVHAHFDQAAPMRSAAFRRHWGRKTRSRVRPRKRAQRA